MQNGKLSAHGSEQVNTPGILRAGEGPKRNRRLSGTGDPPSGLDLCLFHFTS